MRLEKREMIRVPSNMKALACAGTSAVLAAVTFVALICLPLICLSAQRKEESAQAKQEEVKSGAADPQARQRADALLAQMTLDEKIGQMNQLFFFGSKPVESVNTGIRKGQIGSLLFVTDPTLINRLQKVAVTESRLKIPLIFGFDVIHGFHTIFPVPIGMAASWDPKMVEGTQSIAASEARAVGINWTFAPMVDIARDPRWGRIVEGAGEDPYLGALMAAARVRGLQGNDLGADDTLLATAKHFVAYGAAEGGRDYNTAEVSERTLREIYLPPFHAAVKAGAQAVMAAFDEIAGVPMHANRELVRGVLRREFG